MRIIVFGATGNTGKRILAAGVEKGHEMTAYVRSPEKLHEQQGERIAEQVKMVAKDILDPHSVYEALTHQDVAVIAAGNAGQGEAFIRIVDNIVTQCVDHPHFSGRIWVMGGAGLLEIADTGLTGNDLPGLPPVFLIHQRNLDRLRQTQLDWSIMCPSTMTETPAAYAFDRLNITVDRIPLSFSESVKDLSEEELAGQLFSRIQELDVAYEDVVACMLNHLEADGPFKGKRVGIAYRREGMDV
ncbi:NAD(P)-dependent oxidoreductase [Cohnella terricola]|uniref:NAD-dependent epimerase/dehydratase family protein n=1 Tax=Cohnella terricola TaxID=1289167 RepID=A0A559JJ41_9BACL|nr:NAD(P)H-binding protein [Cohnella terricola]TVX99897.1 NAD-dependent epimerase/dehydratase family protein [Cohnella terricola]